MSNPDTSEPNKLPHPLPYTTDSSSHTITLFDAIGRIQKLYLEAMGIGGGGKLSIGTPMPFFLTAGSGPSKKGAQTIHLFTAKNQVIPGGVMEMTQTVTYPSPQGMQTTTRARVDELFENAPLTSMLNDEEKKRLKDYTYHELDEMRFAYVAIYEMVSKGTVFDKEGKLTGLAKRDLKKNCKSAVGGGDEEESPAANATPVAGKAGKKGITAPAAPSVPTIIGGKPKKTGDASKPQPAKLGAVEREMKAILHEECTKLWPHTPPEKSAQMTLEQDKNQPRHKPLFQATVMLQHVKKMSLKGEWCRTKRDAENSAAQAALKQLHSGKPLKK